MAYSSPRFSDLMCMFLDCAVICVFIKVVLKIKLLNEVNNNAIVFVTVSVLMFELLLFPA